MKKSTDTFYAIELRSGVYHMYNPLRLNSSEETRSLNDAQLFHNPKSAVAFCNRNELSRDHIIKVTVTRSITKAKKSEYPWNV